MTDASSTKKFVCEPCTFEDVLPFWRDKLWPRRQSPIEPVSAMKWLSGYRTTRDSTPLFWCVRDSGKIVGVLSGHFAGVIDGSMVDLDEEIRSFRIRGIWVEPEYRRKGLMRAMLEAAFEAARQDDCQAVWIFPRQGTASFYEPFGFKRMSGWIQNRDSQAGGYGGNCYAIKKL